MRGKKRFDFFLIGPLKSCCCFMPFHVGLMPEHNFLFDKKLLFNHIILPFIGFIIGFSA